MQLGLSTSWNALRHTNGREMLSEIASAGFTSAELSFNLTAAMVREVGELHAAGSINVLSLHNYCPIPEGLERADALPDCFSLASLDEQARQKAVFFTKRTIDTAVLLRASVVILHAGRVEIPDHTRTLIEYARRGMKGSPEYASLRSQMVQLRSDRARAHLHRVLQSLDELNRYAEGRSIKLGIETRFYHREIPSLEEVGVILECFRGGSIYYWHDIGHAQLMEELGFWRHREYLSAYAGQLLGMHLHDMREYQDHLPPSQGTIDFGFIREYLTPTTLMILEAHQPATADALVKSRSFLEEVLHVTFDR